MVIRMNDEKKKNAAARSLGRKGGKARRDKLDAEQRQAIARAGGLARQEKARKAKVEPSLVEPEVTQ